MSEIEFVKVRKYNTKKKKCDNVLLLTCGDFSFSLENVSFAKTKMIWYKQISRGLSWIENDRIKLFFFLKTIEGMTVRGITNMIFNKEHLKDKFYHTVGI